MPQDKIVLVIPPTPFLGEKAHKIPLGILYVHATLKSLGYLVTIEDCTGYTTWDEISTVLRQIAVEYPLIGFTGTSAHAEFLLRAVKYIRTINKNTKCIVGGPVASAETKRMLEWFDLVVVGNIESIDAFDLKKRRGLFISPSLPKKLDTIVKPDRSLLQYLANGTYPIITSRYCPYECSFCNNSTKDIKEALKRHSIARVLDEIDDCRTLGARRISFQDDTFVLSVRWIIKLCDAMIKTNRIIPFDCRARADIVNEEVLTSMVKAGCTAISYGIESGSQNMLDRMNKLTTVEQNSTALSLTKSVGIQTKAYFLIGIPGETEASLLESIAWLDQHVDLIDKLYLYMWIPFPGSKLSKEEGFTFKRLHHGTDRGHSVLGNGLYRSAYDNRAVIETDTMSTVLLEEYFEHMRNRYAHITAFGG